ncbi:alpha/beta hydrolase fold domain-containing protein [Companilactobacillus versmoldensis]|nr:alpha/beta hydrolase fold domain-containing protein [Companilactobacillus versmoldensis]
MMLANDYALELHRLQQVGPVDIPHIDGVKMIVKDRLDPHTYDPIILNHLKKLVDDPTITDDLFELRSGDKPEFNEADYPNVKIEHYMSTEMSQAVPYLKIFSREATDQKALIYMHGGAYYAGSANETLEPLTRLAQEFSGIIYSVDYRLCPENPYPASVLDCLSVVLMASRNHEELILAGDSAGASIALGVSQLAQQLGVSKITNHLLFYPTVIHGSNLLGPILDDKKVPIRPDERPVLHANYQQFRQLDRIMTKYYTSGENVDLTSPIISPLYADPTWFKKVTILIGEFDPFRFQAEAFAQEVGTACGEVNFIRYGGLGHAFLNFLGQVAASEDSIREAGLHL